MRYAILSDIHANRDALDRVLADATAQGAETFICLGDVVGYGPRPAETVSRIRETCAVVLAGNHDDAVSGRGDASDFIDLAGDAVSRHREALGPKELAWLGSLPYSCTLEGAVAAHGDICDPSKFYYVENEDDASANFSAGDWPLLFVGHTHVPGLFLTGHSGTVYHTDAQDFTIEDGKRYIVNVGSVGYPREANGQCLSSYVLYDSAERTVCFRFLPFSVASVMQRGRSPRRLGLLTLVTLLLGAAAFAATLVLLLTPDAPLSDGEANLIDSRAMSLDSHPRLVRANLTLEKNSPPVLLRTSFKDAQGNTISVESQTVRKSSAKGLKIAEGATRVEFDIFKIHSEDAPRISAFNPSDLVR